MKFDALYQECFQAMLVLCRVMVYVSARRYARVPASETQDDSLANREQFATQQLDSIVVTNTTDWTVAGVCRFLPDMLVPLIAMTANVFSLYGWGKRKCRTKRCWCSCKLASNLKQIVKDIRTVRER